MTTVEDLVFELDRALNVHKVTMLDLHEQKECPSCALQEFVEVILYDVKKELKEADEKSIV